MKQKAIIYGVLLLLCLCVAERASAVTYRLQRVTSVEAGSKYVFEQAGYVMSNTIKSNALSSTNSFKTTGLTGNESYVWERYSNDRLKNVTGSEYYLYNNTNNLQFGSSSTTNKYKWIFTFQSDGTANITNVENSTSYIGQMGITDSRCKLYSKGNLSITPYSFVVYKLVEESKSSSDLHFDKLFVQHTIGMSETIYPELVTSSGFDGTVSYSSSNEKVATVNSTTGEVSIIGAGRALITASWNETGLYGAGESTYTLMVMDGNGTDAKPYSVTDFLSGYMEVKDDTYVQGYIVGYYNDTNSPFTTIANDNANVALSDFRDAVSWDNTIPVKLSDALKDSYGLWTNPEYMMRRIKVSGPVNIYRTKYGIYGTSTVGFSTTHPVSVTSYQYATYRTSEKLDFTDLGVSAYTATINDDKVVLTKIEDGVVDAGKGVVLYSETAGTFDVPVTSKSVTVTDTGLEISDGTNATSANGIYVLGKKNENVGFYRWVGGSSLSAGKVFLPAPAGESSAREYLAFMFDEESTLVREMKDEKKNTNQIGDWFALDGRHLATKPTAKGLYVVNGKKVFVK